MTKRISATLAAAAISVVVSAGVASAANGFEATIEGGPETVQVRIDFPEAGYECRVLGVDAGYDMGQAKNEDLRFSVGWHNPGLTMVTWQAGFAPVELGTYDVYWACRDRVSKTVIAGSDPLVVPENVRAERTTVTVVEFDDTPVGSPIGFDFGSLGS